MLVKATSVGELTGCLRNGEFVCEDLLAESESCSTITRHLLSMLGSIIWLIMAFIGNGKSSSSVQSQVGPAGAVK